MKGCCCCWIPVGDVVVAVAVVVAGFSFGSVEAMVLLFLGLRIPLA